MPDPRPSQRHALAARSIVRFAVVRGAFVPRGFEDENVVRNLDVGVEQAFLRRSSFNLPDASFVPYPISPCVTPSVIDRLI